MSALRLRIELTRPARRDVRDILSFTLQIHGERQVAEYKRRINSAIKAIADNPHIGRKKHGRFGYQTGRHLIFYRVDESSIYVLRILHDRMDAVRHLPEGK